MLKSSSIVNQMVILGFEKFSQFEGRNTIIPNNISQLKSVLFQQYCIFRCYKKNLNNFHMFGMLFDFAIAQ